MPTQVRERKRNGTTKCNSIAAVRPIQPPPASQTQRTSNSSAAASSGVASSTDGSQSGGAPQEVSREIPAFAIAIANGREVRVRVRLASENAASSASTEASPKPAKKSKIRGDGNPTRVGNCAGSYMARAQGIDFASSVAIEEAIPPYKGSRYGQHPFPTSRLVDARGNTSTDKIWCYQEVGKWRRMSPKEQQAEVDFLEGIDRAHRWEERFAADQARQAKKKAETAAKKAEKKRKDRAAKKAAAAVEEELLADGEVEGGTVSLICFIGICNSSSTNLSLCGSKAITSRVLNAAEYSQQSACRRAVSKPRKPRRKQSDHAQQESNLWDQAGRRATHTMAQTFHKSSVSLTAGPEVDSERWRVRNNIQVQCEESADRTTMDLQVHTSHGGEAAAQEIVDWLLASGRFEMAVQRHINRTGMTPQPMPLDEMEEPRWQYTTNFISSLQQYNESRTASVAPTSDAADVSLSDDKSDTTMNYNDNVDELLADAGVEAFGPVLAEI